MKELKNTKKLIRQIKSDLAFKKIKVPLFLMIISIFIMYFSGNGLFGCINKVQVFEMYVVLFSGKFITRSFYKLFNSNRKNFKVRFLEFLLNMSLLFGPVLLVIFLFSII